MPVKLSCKKSLVKYLNFKEEHIHSSSVLNQTQTNKNKTKTTTFSSTSLCIELMVQTLEEYIKYITEMQFNSESFRELSANMDRFIFFYYISDNASY
jgi:hypothetical protein